MVTLALRAVGLCVAAAALTSAPAFSADAPANARAAANSWYAQVQPARSGQPAWFGLKTPGPETDPTVGVLPAGDIPAAPAAFGPGPKDPLLSGAAIKRDLGTIVGFSLESRAAGEYLWGRVTGRPAYDRTTRWTLEQFIAAGISNAKLEPFTAPPFALPVAGEVRLIANDELGAGSRDVTLASAMVGGSGPVNGEVMAPLIYVGQATGGDLLGRDVKGKIAVLNATPNPGLYSTNERGRMAALIEAGAAGVIEILQQPGNMKSFDRDRHGCGRSLCFTIGGEDGYFLQNVLGEAARAGKSISARLFAKSEVLDAARMDNVVAVIPGRTDRAIVVNAHADGWFTAADDNGGGLAVLVALGRHLAKAPPAQRSVILIASAGHHTAANGLAAYREAHDHDQVPNADLIVNLEHVAVSGMVRSLVEQQDTNFGYRLVPTTAEWPKQVGVSNKAPFLVDLWRKGATCFGLALQRVVDGRNPGELGRFAELPVPQTQMISVSHLYHTSGETSDAVPAEGLERAARFFAYMVREAANAPDALLKGAPYTPTRKCPATP